MCLISCAAALACVAEHRVVLSLIHIWAMCKRGFALTGAILYAVSMVLFPMYFFFVIVQMILSFVGFAKLKKPRPAASDPVE